MKLTRKLIPAFAMLLVSAVLMSTASFAWFSMNQSVTATGISVTATAPESLTISVKSATEGFGSTVALTSDNTLGQVSPVTAYQKDGATLNADNAFYKLSADAAKTVNEAGTLTGDAATAEVADNDYYDEATTTDVYKEDLWLRLDGSEATKNLKVKATYTTTPETDIKNAFHVLIVDGEGKKLVDIDMGTSNGTAVALGTAAVTGNQDATALTVYVYLDGRDTDCKNANIKAAAIAGIDLEFSLA